MAILTSAHDPEDGRLRRHARIAQQSGLHVDLLVMGRRRRRLTAPLWLARTVWAIKPHVVLLPDPELFIPGAILARILRIRAVIDIHEDYRAVAASRRWIPRWLRSIVGLLAAINTSIGRRLATASVVAAAHLARHDDRVVENIPDPKSMPRPTADHQPFCVYVGDVTVDRGAFDMLEAMTFAEPTVELEVIGPIRPELEAELREAIQSLGLGTRVRLRGRLSWDESWSRASAAIAGLCLLRDTPAYRTAVASKIWEYMAVGLPIVASDLPGQRPVIERSSSGFVVGSPREAGLALSRVFGDPSLRQRMDRAGRRAASRRWEASRPDLQLLDALGSPTPMDR